MTDRTSKYGWYILTLSMLTYGFIAGTQRMCMPVLFKEISLDLGLSMVQIGTIWGVDPLAGVFIALPAGLLADRFGVKRTLTVVCLLAGVFSALRGLSVSFLTLALSTFLFGFTAAATPGVVPKTTAVWFSGRRLGLANALLSIAWSCGSMVGTMLSATVLSPWLGGWRNVLFFYGAPAIILGLLWLTTGREPRKSELPAVIAANVPFKQSLPHVVRLKQVWGLGLVTMCLWGTTLAVNGFLSLYLRNIGWAPVLADSAITILSAGSIVGTIPLIVLADRLRARRGVFVSTIVVQAVTLALLPMAEGPIVWVLIIVNGLVRGGMLTLMNVLIFETRGVGSKYAGTAVGLTSTVGMIGGFFSAPLGNSLAGIDPGLPLVFWGFLSVLALPIFFFVREARQKDAAAQ